MVFQIIIPARSNSKRLPGKNMKNFGGKPLIQHSIDFALNHFDKESIWVNSDDEKIIQFAIQKGVKTTKRPIYLALDETPTVEVLKFQIDFFKKENIICDAIILFQPTNPFRKAELLNQALEKFKESKRNSLATFSISHKKIGKIQKNYFRPINYQPGQRSQDLNLTYYENGLIYITKSDSIINGEILTDDVYPFICENIEASVDIDTIEDFKFAEILLKQKR